MTRPARSRAAASRLRWPACRFPMVGTRATRPPPARQPRTRSRTAATVVTTSMDCAASETVFRRRITARTHGLHVARDRRAAVGRAGHEIAHEARLAPRGDVEDVVQHEDLAVGVGTGAAEDRKSTRLNS